MARLDEVEISKTILCAYHEKLLDRLTSDVTIVGAGPSGLVAAFFLAQSGAKVTILEKRLSPGGGIWGGGMGMNVAVVQEEAVPLLSEMGIRGKRGKDGLYAVDAIELSAGLCWNAVPLLGPVEQLLGGTRRHWTAAVLTRKQPLLRPILTPIGAQFLQEPR